MLRKISAVACSFALAAALFNCVGDEPTSPTPNPDAGGDSGGGGTTDSSSGQDSGADTGTDSGQKCAIAQAGTAGSLDPSFAGGLKVFPIPQSNAVPKHTYDTETIAIDSQGRIYIVGRAQNCVSDTSSFDIAVMRLAASGLVDSTFNGGKGYACFDVGDGSNPSDSVLAAYMDASDRLVFAGEAGNKAMIGRLLSTGGLDPSFAGGSVFTFTPESPAGGAAYTAYGVSPDGTSILVSGADQHPFTESAKGWVVRVSDTGALETGAFPPYLNANVAGFRGGHVKLDGKIYLPAKKNASTDWTMVILDANGVATGAAGSATLPDAGATTLPQGITIASAAGQEDQLFVAGGHGAASSGVATWWTKAGAHTGPAPTFANYHIDRAYNRTPVARQCDHKVLFAAVSADTYRPIITRLAGRDGTPDTAFGTSGVAKIEYDAGGAKMGGIALASRADGRLVVAAQTEGLDGAWIYQLLP